MKAASFEYHKPSRLEDALRLLDRFAAEDGRVIAGGQSLVPMMAYRIVSPRHLIDINGIAELSALAQKQGDICVGACVRHATLERFAGDWPTEILLRTIARHIAHYPIRVRGTMCGSLAHADPASEWCLASVALGVTLVLQTATRRRELDASAFFEGMMTTQLGADEMIVEVRVPRLPEDSRFGFCEFNRRAGDYAIAMTLVTGSLRDGLIREPRVAIGGAEAKPRRISALEESLDGARPESSVFDHVSTLAAAVIEPIEDHINTADYRRDIVRALTRRALAQAFT